jgi:hypothetical protein
MHPTVHEMMLHANRRDLDRMLRNARFRVEQITATAPAEPVTRQLSTVGDEASLARLAEHLLQLWAKQPTQDRHQPRRRVPWGAIRAWRGA